MAIVVVNEMAGADQSVYDDVNPRVMPDGQLPELSSCARYEARLARSITQPG